MSPADFCPPLFLVKLARIDEPARHHTDTYGIDEDFFKKRPKRRTMLRIAAFKEFDGWARTFPEWCRTPKLWVLVTQITPGVHCIVPVYRGEASFFQAVQDSDENVAYVVSEMFRRLGCQTEAAVACEALSAARASELAQQQQEIVH